MTRSQHDNDGYASSSSPASCSSALTALSALVLSIAISVSAVLSFPFSLSSADSEGGGGGEGEGESVDSATATATVTVTVTGSSLLYDALLDFNDLLRDIDHRHPTVRNSLINTLTKFAVNIRQMIMQPNLELDDRTKIAAASFLYNYYFSLPRVFAAARTRTRTRSSGDGDGDGDGDDIDDDDSDSSNTNSDSNTDSNNSIKNNNHTEIIDTRADYLQRDLFFALNLLSTIEHNKITALHNNNKHNNKHNNNRSNDNDNNSNNSNNSFNSNSNNHNNVNNNPAVYSSPLELYLTLQFDICHSLLSSLSSSSSPSSSSSFFPTPLPSTAAVLSHLDRAYLSLQSFAPLLSHDDDDDNNHVPYFQLRALKAALTLARFNDAIHIQRQLDETLALALTLTRQGTQTTDDNKNKNNNNNNIHNDEGNNNNNKFKAQIESSKSRKIFQLITDYLLDEARDIIDNNNIDNNNDNTINSNNNSMKNNNNIDAADIVLNEPSLSNLRFEDWEINFVDMKFKRATGPPLPDPDSLALTLNNKNSKNNNNSVELRKSVLRFRGGLAFLSLQARSAGSNKSKNNSDNNIEIDEGDVVNLEMFGVVRGSGSRRSVVLLSPPVLVRSSSNWYYYTRSLILSMSPSSLCEPSLVSGMSECELRGTYQVAQQWASGSKVNVIQPIQCALEATVKITRHDQNN